MSDGLKLPDPTRLHRIFNKLTSIITLGGRYHLFLGIYGIAIMWSIGMIAFSLVSQSPILIAIFVSNSVLAFIAISMLSVSDEYERNMIFPSIDNLKELSPYNSSAPYLLVELFCGIVVILAFLMMLGGLLGASPGFPVQVLPSLISAILIIRSRMNFRMFKNIAQAIAKDIGH